MMNIPLPSSPQNKSHSITSGQNLRVTSALVWKHLCESYFSFSTCKGTYKYCTHVLIYLYNALMGRI